MRESIQNKHLITVISITMVMFASSRVYKYCKHKDLSPVQKVESEKIAEENKSSEPKIQETTLSLAKGSNIEKMLINFGVSQESALQISNAISKDLPNKSLKAGQSFDVRFIKDVNGISVQSFVARQSIDTKLIVTLADGEYRCDVEKIQLTPAVHVFEGTLNSSFYSCALKAGVPAKIVQDAVDVLSNVVNFQHGIKSGASFKILCEALTDSSGKVIQIKQMKYVSLNTGIADHKMYAFNEGGKVRFFDEKGCSINRSLLQTPLNAAKLRVTSGFGHRVHPLLGYTKMHTGVDFGAPTGTPVLAAGSGKVIACGWYGGYGNRVVIAHAGGYKTLYGHLSRIDKSIKVGALVDQRQVIGAVGMTGTATGPHLHFEVLLNNRHINPMKVQSLPSLKLTGGSLQKFGLVKTSLEKEIVSFIQTKEKVTL